MPSLPKQQRTLLSNAVKKGRRVADAGARKALEALAVAHHEPAKSMSKDERDLRNRLRAHGKQLGDKRDAQRGTQEIAKLAAEVAYEHWHRILFARFLAECDLLIEPESGMAVSIDEVRELARERNADWIDLAASWAQRMLPQIFRSGDPVLEVALPPESRLELEEIVESLPQEVFLAGDSLGWVYQFWQAEEKAKVNKSGKKIGAEDLPAVTQLFTEDYMVDFLLDNTLGAWWAGKKFAENPELARVATVDPVAAEEELRRRLELPNVPWSYLRFVRVEDESYEELHGNTRNSEDLAGWRPAAGTFDGWPKEAKYITCLDPCMGSGHFIAAMFTRLVAMRMAEEDLDEKNAIRAVIEKNLFGLEIDPRCTQIAAFNLGLAAWKRIGYHVLPTIQLACSGLGINTQKAEWLSLANGDAQQSEALSKLWDMFADAPLLGSLIEPRILGDDLFTAAFDEVSDAMSSLLAKEIGASGANELALAAQGVAKAASILSSQYVLIATNVPYLGQGSHSAELAAYLAHYSPSGKRDIANAFIQRILGFCGEHGTYGVVTQRACTYLTTDKDFRREVLLRSDLNAVVAIGARGFETISGERVDVVLLVGTKTKPLPHSRYAAIDVAPLKTAQHKAIKLTSAQPVLILHEVCVLNKDALILTAEVVSRSLFGTIANCYQGLSTGDAPRYLRFFWEISDSGGAWVLAQGPPAETRWVAGLERVVSTDVLGGDVEGSAIRGREIWGRRGVSIGQMTQVPASGYFGTVFLDSAPVIIPKKEADLELLWAFCSSSHFHDELRKINPKLSVNNGYIGKIPFDASKWQERERASSTALPASYSGVDCTQALFEPASCHRNEELQVALCRLLGFRWPRESWFSLPEFPSLPAAGDVGLSDADGIVGLVGLKGELTAGTRLNAWFSNKYADSWSAERNKEILENSGIGNEPLELWLRDAFFRRHCELFHETPFVWQIWDGVKDGFSALVSYQRLAAPNGEGRKTLEKLRYSYLGDWIERQRADAKCAVEGADLRLAAAEHLAGELEKILHGEPPYDIFVRWKPLQEQPIGWEPDINDGVRINIRPFMMAKPFKAKGKNACILRATPNIKWGKDRGKEPMRPKEDYPWFWGWDEQTEDFAGGPTFDGNRWNDLHYTRAFKEAARARKRERG